MLADVCALPGREADAPLQTNWMASERDRDLRDDFDFYLSLCGPVRSPHHFWKNSSCVQVSNVVRHRKGTASGRRWYRWKLAAAQQEEVSVSVFVSVTKAVVLFPVVWTGDGDG